ncbi:MAG: T9SS type A sorting domain-containing protein [Bacteroidetes bacterium]|nr:T9SS type A sorting domain-containing protein [Bacteroidota bacterium]
MRCLITLFLVLIFTSSCYDSSAQNFRLKILKREAYDYTSSRMYVCDSAVYFYSGKKMGSFSNNSLVSVSPIYDRWVDVFLKMYPNMQYDSATFITYWPSGSVKSNHMLQQTIDMNSNIILFSNATYSLPASPPSTSIDTYSYIGNKMTEHRNFGVDRYVYNSLGQLDTIISSSSGITAYFYNSSGQLTQILSTNYYYGKQDYSYNSSGQLISISSYAKSGSAWVLANRFSYTYTSAGNIDVEIREFNPFGKTPISNFSKKEYSYDASNKVTSYIYHGWNISNSSWDTLYRYDYTYNSADLMSTIESRYWINGSWDYYNDTSSSSSRLTFIYEPNWPTNINEQTADASIKLYPSPSSAFIRIEIDKVFTQDFKAAIYDIQGRVVRQWTEPKTNTYSRTIPLTELPNGSYILKLSTQEGELTKQFQVMK